MSALPQHPSTFHCSHPNAFIQPHLHQGGCSGGGHLGLSCQGCCGACSTPFSRLLQPSVRCVEDLGVVASGHRPLPSQSLCGCVSLSDGDHSVCAPVSASGGLDGLHRSERSVSSSAGSSSFSSLSSLRLQRQSLPVQSAVLWPLHGSAGLHQGHGSCFRNSPFYGDPYETVSRRLACPVFLSGVPPPGSSDCPPPLPRVGDCYQPSEIQPGSITGGSVSGGCHRHNLFQGFSVAGAHLQAPVNSRRISVLRLASRELMALAAGRSFFAGSPGSWRQTEDAVPPDLPPSLLGSSGSRGSSVCVGGVSPRPPVVAPPLSSVSRSVSARCLPTYTSGQTWGGVPISIARSLQACGTRTRWRCPSTPGNCSPSNWVFTSSSHLYRVAGWLSFATTPQRWLIFARREVQDLLSSTPWLRRSCAGRSHSPSAWLRSSSRAPTTSSRTPCLALTNSHIQSGH